MPLLRVIMGMNPGQEFHLEGENYVLGRHPNCDIVLEVGAVSRQHAQVIRSKDGFYVEDLKSRNGTLVNDVAIKGRTLLKHGDELKICDMAFTYVDEKAPPAQRTPVESTLAVMFDDDKENSGSTIMTRLDVSSSSAGLRLAVKPEEKLKALIEISKSLARSLGTEQVLPTILETLFRVFVQADRGFVILRDGTDAPLHVKAVKYRRGDTDETPRFSRTIVQQVLQSKEAILSADATSDARFAMSESLADFRIRSMMCAPLVTSGDEAIGIIQIDTLDQRKRFQGEDLDVLAAVASQAAFALENARMHEQAVWQEAIKRDLALAHNIQKGFLPKTTPDVAGYDFFHFYEPANLVGGDFYDYVPLPGDRVAVFVADVSGKGVSAALLMARMLAEARYHLAREQSPREAVNRMARGFGKLGWDDRFVTMVLMVLDCKTHEVTIVNAGHMAPFLRRPDGKVEEAAEEITGVPLGVDPDWEYDEQSFLLEPGASLTAFTDGFSEAANADNDMYGMERLQSLVSAPAKTAKEMGERILADVEKFVDGYKQSDDMCLLCFGRTSGGRARA